MLEVSFACIGVLIVVCILLAVRVNHLERWKESAEKRLDSLDTLTHRTATKLGDLMPVPENLRWELKTKDEQDRETFHRFERLIQESEKRLSALEEKVSDAYETVEAQAKKEKLLFDGISSIMDYDIATARKAVNSVGER